MDAPPKPNPFRGGDPVGHPLEDGSRKQTPQPPQPPNRLSAYRPAGTEVPRYVGPTDRRKGKLRRTLWAIYHWFR